MNVRKYPMVFLVGPRKAFTSTCCRPRNYWDERARHTRNRPLAQGRSRRDPLGRLLVL